MPAYFTVVKYVPDVVRDERVNIGVITFSGADKRSLFLENWHRVKVLGGTPSAIKAACADLEQMDVARLRKAMETWAHSIQLSTPCASLLDVNTLLLDTAKRFLVDPEVTERGYKTKADVLRRVKQSLREAVTRNMNAATWKLVRDEFVPTFQGNLELHAFDVYAFNSGPIFGVNAISFEVPNQRSLRQQVDATKWAIEDIRGGSNPNVDLAVVVSRPSKENASHYDQSVEVFQKLRAEVHQDTELEQWSETTANLMRSHFPHFLRPDDGG